MSALGEIHYPADLPISQRREELLATIRDRQVVIVAGETGSGKSTQLPKLCLELGRGVDGLIGHTQPRRLAARTVAERVAEELGTTIGDLVGYTVRFTDQVGDRTRLKVMTDGILLAEIQRDGMLSRYDTLIIDEAHERSLNIDFILGYVRQLLPRRPDLKVIVTSATIDTARFAEHFGGAPVVEVSGRTYPVEMRYRPFGDDVDDDRDQTHAICDAVRELSAEGPGDILVFLSGEREIRDTADAVNRLELRHTEVLPLFARLSSVDQHRVFQPHTGRRVVLATNVAETSLTVPGVRYVVDPGTARISRYNRRTKVQRLPIEPISQASADQRAGRCGRVAPGVCIRLYGEEDFAGRPEFTEPEILRTNLASVILQMTNIGLGDIGAFPFVEPPDARSIDDGIALLEELGAFEPATGGPSRRLTATGRSLAQLPLDPRLARMVLAAERNGCLPEVMVIAAALSIQDPRERPTGKEQAAAESHARFTERDSDFLTYLNLWDHLRAAQAERSSSQFRRMCKAEHLNHLRVREWQDIHGQLRQATRSLRLRAGARAPEADADAIHRSLLAGLLSHLGRRDGITRDFIGARNARFTLAASSVLAKKPPQWVMAAELVETNRMWGRVAARVRPEWAEQLGPHLVKRSYGEPWWDARRGAAMTNERVTLYGLPIVSDRALPYGRVDPDGARDMFIDHALVAGDWQTHHAFVADNTALVEEVRTLEHRARRGNILVEDEAIFAFFDRRVGRDVTSTRHFDRWWKRERAEHPELLTFRWEDVVQPRADDVRPGAFPEVWPDGDLALPLHYVFDPTDELDGVTVDIPLAAVNRVSGAGFDWHVPGLRAELVAALIRSLPKQLRRLLGPATDHAEAFLASAAPDDGPLLDVLGRELARRSGHPVPQASWNLEQLPPYLRMTMRVVDERGRPIAWSKDLDGLRAHVQGRLRDAVTDAARSVERRGLTAWTLGPLPRTVDTDVGGHRVTAFPALVNEGESVGVRVFAGEAEQRRAMWAGTRRLLLLTVGSPTREIQRRLTNATRLALAQAPYASAPEVLVDCITASLDRLIADAGGPAWDEAGYRELHDAVAGALATTAVEAATLAGSILGAAAILQHRLDGLTAPGLQVSLTDVHTQVARLVHPGFVRSTGLRRLPRLLRYLDAVAHRLDKLPLDPRRDRALMERVEEVERAYERALARQPASELTEVRWMIEELRVSLFAQHLGTAEPVSEARIQRAIDRLA